MLVDTGAQVSLVRRGLFKEESQPETGPPEGRQRRDYGWWHPRGHYQYGILGA